MADNVHDVTIATPKAAAPGTYFKVQFRAWTKFDPTNAELSEIARAVEEGNAFITAIEVIRVAADLQQIDDPDVREQFANIAAADRILRNVEELPLAVRDKLRDALGTDLGPQRLAS